MNRSQVKERDNLKNLLLRDLKTLLECCTGLSYGLVFYTILVNQPIRYFRICLLLHDVFSCGQIHKALKRLESARLIECDENFCWKIKAEGFKKLMME